MARAAEQAAGAPRGAATADRGSAAVPDGLSRACGFTSAALSNFTVVLSPTIALTPPATARGTSGAAEGGGATPLPLEPTGHLRDLRGIGSEASFEPARREPPAVPR